MADVFISYPHQAKEEASLFANALQHEGLSTWVFEKDICGDRAKSGEWKRSIEDALRNSRTVAFLVDPRWETSTWIQEEYMQALDSYWAGTTKYLVPVLVGPKTEPPAFLRQWQSLRVQSKSDWDKAASQLAGWIQQKPPIRTAPTRKDKQALEHRLSTITKVAHEWQSSSGEARKIKSSTLSGDNAVVRSSRSGEIRQRGSKKSRSSKAKT